MCQRTLALLVALAFAGCPELRAQSPAPENAAQVANEFITMTELEKAARAELMNLEVQRQNVLQGQLDRLIAARVIKLEAQSRGLTEADLLRQEVIARVTDPSDEEVRGYMQTNRAQTKETPDQAISRIRQSLIEQRRQKIFVDFVETLKRKYHASSFLEPVRVAIAPSVAAARGPATAPVTITEFADFECPYCAALSRTLAEVTKSYGDKVRVVYRHFPLERIHSNAMKAAEVSICAEAQGRFWDVHDRFFRTGGLSDAEITKRASEAGVNFQDLQACLASGGPADRVRADIKAATALGVNSTPSLFINGRPMRGAVSLQEIRRVIDEELTAASRHAESPSSSVIPSFLFR